jgi:membrane peptidoglycan carboxypeptidase
MKSPTESLATRDDRGGRPVRHRRSRLVRLFVAVLVVSLCGTVLAAGMIAILWPLTPSVGTAGQRIYDFLAQHNTTSLTSLPVPDPVGEAVIATENSRFATDFGLDPISVIRTVYTGATGSRDQGAATLENQLAKNLYTPNQGNLKSKVEEVELAFKFDAAYSKNEVLLMYLNAAYYGHNFYGLRAAANGYFRATPDQLTWSQASLLAGLVQAPSAYDPYNHLALARSRQRHVLDRLVATGILTPTQADAAFTAPLHLR